MEIKIEKSDIRIQYECDVFLPQLVIDGQDVDIDCPDQSEYEISGILDWDIKIVHCNPVIELQIVVKSVKLTIKSASGGQAICSKAVIDSHNRIDFLAHLPESIKPELITIRKDNSGDLYAIITF